MDVTFDLYMDIWIVSICLAVVNMLLWTFVHKTFCEHMFLFPLVGFLGVELLGRMVWFCLIFKNCRFVFQSV